MPYLPPTPSGLRPRGTLPGYVGLPGEIDDDDPSELLPGFADDTIDSAIARALASDDEAADLSFGLGERVPVGFDDPMRSSRAPRRQGTSDYGLGASSPMRVDDSARGFAPGEEAPPETRSGILASLAEAFPAPAPGVAGTLAAIGRPSPATPTGQATGATGAPSSPTGPASTTQAATAAPAPSPVSPAPSSDKDTSRSDKMLGRGDDGGFGMSTDERTGLATARQGDRRMRIAQGVTGGLGGLLAAIGAGTGNTALAGLGMGVRGVGAAIPAGIREERALGDIERRQAAMQADEAAANRARQMAVAEQGAGTQRLAAESRAALQSQQAQRIAAEDALRAGNAAAMREFIRGRVRAAPDGPRRNALAAATAPGSAFDELQSEDALLSMLDAAESIDPAGAQIARINAGGTSRGTWSEGPNGDPIWVPGRSTGRQAPPAPADPYAQFAPAAAPVAAGAPVAPPPASVVEPARGPSARPGRARRQAAAAPAQAPAQAPAPAPAPGAAPAPAATTGAIDLGPQGEINDYTALMRLQGVDINDESFRIRRNSHLRRLTSGDESQVRAARAEMATEAQAATGAQGGGMPVGLPRSMQPEWTRFRTEATPFDRAAQAGLTTANELTALRNRNRDAFDAAVAFAGNSEIPLTGDAQRIRARISEILSNRLHELSGAAVSVPEFRRISDSMGTGSFLWGGQSDVFINTIRAGARRSATEYRSRRDAFDSRIPAAYEATRYGGGR
jgi:hypothetical protein